MVAFVFLAGLGLSMSASIYSTSWYLVSAMQINLRSHVRIDRHVYRGEIWYTLQDRISGQHHRITAQAYAIVGRLDGVTKLETIWQKVCEQLDEDMPTQDELIELLSQLFRAGLLHADRLPDIFELQQRAHNIKSRKLFQQMKSPLGIKIPLLDPDTFLNRSAAYALPLLSRAGAWLWCFIVVLALLLAALHWRELTENLSDRVLSLNNVLLLMCIYPLVKTVHELGHAYVVKKWGGEVHEMGVMLLVLFPVPYVDASTASAFPNKYQRMLVGAAGVMVEAFIAALAMMVWALAEPGLLRALAFNTMMIAGVSTVFFNGNPLLKFDAYYVLADYLEIPNLATRSNQHIAYLVKYFGFGIGDIERVAKSANEAMILTVYAICAFTYRMFIMCVIALFIASEYFVVGILLALWSMYTGLLGPLLKLFTKPFSDVQLKQKKHRASLIAGTVAALIWLLLCVVPFPRSTYVQGVFIVSDDDFVRASADGFVRDVYASVGEHVQAHQTLIAMDAPELHARNAQLRAVAQEAEARLQAALLNRNDLAAYRELLAYSERESAKMAERVRTLSLASSQAGEFIIADADNLIGRYVRRGEVLASVVEPASIPLTALVREDDIYAVLKDAQGVEVRLVGSVDTQYNGKILHAFPASTRVVASEILTVEGGGQVVVNPQSAQELVSIEPYFRLLISIPNGIERRLNQRGHIVFRHSAEPLIYRIWRAARRVFLRQLDV